MANYDNILKVFKDRCGDVYIYTPGSAKTEKVHMSIDDMLKYFSTESLDRLYFKEKSGKIRMMTLRDVFLILGAFNKTPSFSIINLRLAYLLVAIQAYNLAIEDDKIREIIYGQ